MRLIFLCDVNYLGTNPTAIINMESVGFVIFCNVNGCGIYETKTSDYKQFHIEEIGETFTIKSHETFGDLYKRVYHLSRDTAIYLLTASELRNIHLNYDFSLLETIRDFYQGIGYSYGPM